VADDAILGGYDMADGLHFCAGNAGQVARATGRRGGRPCREGTCIR
jgi:hypothetical protein